MKFVAASRLAHALAVIAVTLAACDWTKPKIPGEDQLSAQKRQDYVRRMKRACASSETYDRLKVLTFDQALAARPDAITFLDRLAASTTIRIEEPVAKSRDDRLDVTVCQGHLVLDLPPTAGRPKRLESDVEYSAQQAADGSGLVYELRGGDRVVEALAALATPTAIAKVTAPTSSLNAAQPQRVEPDEAGPFPTSVSKAGEQPTAHLREQTARDVEPELRVERTPPVVRPARPGKEMINGDADRGFVAARPSFRCSGVTSRVLRMVCSDPALAAADRRMSSNFYAALASSDDQTRARLRSTRDRFINFRNRCDSAACVAQAYSDRNAEIRDIERAR